jgi:hypothetical protein
MQDRQSTLGSHFSKARTNPKRGAYRRGEAVGKRDSTTTTRSRQWGFWSALTSGRCKSQRALASRALSKPPLFNRSPLNQHCQIVKRFWIRALRTVRAPKRKPEKAREAFGQFRTAEVRKSARKQQLGNSALSQITTFLPLNYHRIAQQRGTARVGSNPVRVATR